MEATFKEQGVVSYPDSHLRKHHRLQYNTTYRGYGLWFTYFCSVLSRTWRSNQIATRSWRYKVNNHERAWAWAWWCSERLVTKIFDLNNARWYTHFMEGNDVFNALPTGSGKSLCYAVLPYAFDALYHREGSIWFSSYHRWLLFKGSKTCLTSITFLQIRSPFPPYCLIR